MVDKATLDAVLEDFKEFSREGMSFLETVGSFNQWKERLFQFSHPQYGQLLYLPVDLIWFGEGAGPQFDQVYATPEDYSRIRNDERELRLFLGNLFDRGRLPCGQPGVLDTSDDISPSTYVIWMYEFSENGGFKRNLEKVTMEMMDEEFARSFLSPDVSGERDEPADYTSLKRFSKQFYRLVGLLEVVRDAGAKDKGFAKVYNLLKQKVKEKFGKSMPKVRFNNTIEDLYGLTSQALIAVQPEEDLSEFWLEMINYDELLRDESDISHVDMYGEGFFRSYERRDDRMRQVCRYIKRIFDLDERRVTEGTRECGDEYESFLHCAVFNIGYWCFGENIESDGDVKASYDPQRRTVDILQFGTEPNDPVNLTRFSETGYETFSGTYNKETKTFLPGI